MPANACPIPTLEEHLPEAPRMGDPDAHWPLEVFPLFGPEPGLDYVSFAQGRAAGVTIKELEHRASVNDLLVLNPTDRAVLLYEGEEVLGAQQNRVFDVSVLVAARSSVQVPVSCVEAGRWDAHRHRETFSPAPQAAYPSLRSLKNRSAQANALAGAPPRAEQDEVWEEVSHMSGQMGVASDTGAMHDIYDGHRDRIAEFSSAIHLQDGQTGTLVCIAGSPAVLDHVSRPQAFAALHAPLVQGYALEALGALDTLAAGAAPLAPGREGAEAFLEKVLRARITQHDGIGLGRDVRFAEAGVAGAGLVAGDELVQLSAFPHHAPGASPGQASAARILRPSHRRAE